MLRLKSSPGSAIIMKCNAIGKVVFVPTEVDFWISVFLITDAALSLLPPFFSCTTSITLLPGTLLPDFLWEPALSHPLVHTVYMEQTPGMSRRLVLLI